MKKAYAGFTLIELMIAVVIVALLTAVALPSFLEHLNKGRRSEGQAALLRAVQLQERFYTANGRYANDNELPALFGLAAHPVYSGENPALATGRYALTVIDGDCADRTICVTIQAAPVAPWTDDNCGTLTLNSRGVRTESGSKDLAYCWR